MVLHLPITALLLLSTSFLITEPRQFGIPPPVLISPANGALMDNGCKPRRDGIVWDFDWSDFPPGTIYHIRVSRKYNPPIINDWNVQSSSYHYVSAPKDHIINSNRKQWNWVVRARVNGIWGAWSALRTFRVEKLNTDCPK